MTITLKKVKKKIVFRNLFTRPIKDDIASLAVRLTKYWSDFRLHSTISALQMQPNTPFARVGKKIKFFKVIPTFSHI